MNSRQILLFLLLQLLCILCHLTYLCHSETDTAGNKILVDVDVDPEYQPQTQQSSECNSSSSDSVSSTTTTAHSAEQGSECTEVQVPPDSNSDSNSDPNSESNIQHQPQQKNKQTQSTKTKTKTQTKTHAQTQPQGRPRPRHRMNNARYSTDACPGTEYGWSCDYTPDFSQRDGDHFFCDIDVIPYNTSAELFFDKYLFKRPVLIDAATDAWGNTSFWSRANLMALYANYSFEAGRSLELVLNSGIGKWNSTFYEYWQDSKQLHLDFDDSVPEKYQYAGLDAGHFKEDLYIFDRSLWREDVQFQFENIDAPQYLFNSDVQYGILFFGVSGTGATWHAHGETWAGVAFGRKRWMLYPPEITPAGGFWPGYSAKDWFRNLYPHIKDHKVPENLYSWNNEHENMEVGTEIDIEMGADISLKMPRQDIYSRRILKQKDGKKDGKKDGDGDGDGDEYMEVIKLNSDSTIAEIIATDHALLNAQHRYGYLYAPIECVQSEGQLLYLPEFWWHAVLNSGDTIAFGLQTSDSYTAWMQEINELGDYERMLHDKKRKKAHRPVLTDLEKDVIHYEMMRVHERLGEYSPNNAVHPFFVGYEYFDLNRFYVAEEYMTQALLMDPTYIEGYVSLAKMYREFESDPPAPVSPSQSESGHGEDNTVDEDIEYNRVYDLYHRYLAERLLRIAYILNHNHPIVRELLIDTFEEQENEQLIELVHRHLPLPPVIEFESFEDFLEFDHFHHEHEQEEQEQEQEQR